MTNLNKDINRSFVFNFAATASKEDVEWIVERTRYWQDKMGKVRYFSPLRKEFIDKFFPQERKAPKKKPTLLEELEALVKQTA